MCVTVTVVTGHSVALNRRSHLFSTMSSLHDVLVHDNVKSTTDTVFCSFLFVGVFLQAKIGISSA
jgi:hypothetical protein